MLSKSDKENFFMSRLEKIQSRLAKEEIKKPLLARFLRYVKVYTTADPSTPEDQVPSNPNIWNFAKQLSEELQALGVTDVQIDEHSSVIGKIPASPGYENAPSIAFISHMDTAVEVTGQDVKPQIHENYDGSPIQLCEGVIVDPMNQVVGIPDIVGDTLITTDGTTLLGGDDKAGIANIMTAVDLILNVKKIPHGPFEVVFTSDEEIGRSEEIYPVEKTNSKIAYTVDGECEGEANYECFSAYKAIVTFHGKSVHTGYARGKLVNCVAMASQFVSMLPRSESPEATDGRYGFYAPMSIEGSVDSAKVMIILRDYEIPELERRAEVIRSMAKTVEQIYNGAKIEVKIVQQYLNMKEHCKKDPRTTQFIEKAAQTVGVDIEFKPIRGGTDGAGLCQRGVITPNIWVGAANLHSRTEFVILSQMISSTEMIIEILKLWSLEK